MKICIKADTNNYSTATLQILRKQSSESLAEIKHKLLNNLPLLYFDFFEDDYEKIIGIIEELEKSGLQLSFYNILYNGDEEKIDSVILKHLYESHLETSEYIGWDMEIEATEIIVSINKNLEIGSANKLIHQDDQKNYYLFEYSQELVDFINDNSMKSATVEYYQRGRDDENMQEWEPISVDRIFTLMRVSY
jgi:hypothetical protein